MSLRLLYLCLGWTLILSCGSDPEVEDSPPNILFIAVDDLRPELGCYGEEHIHSPNIDRLAASGTLFWNSYCNIPVCGASRASIITGLRPTYTRFKNYFTRADEDAPGIPTLPGVLKAEGYKTISNGKILHVKEDSQADWDEIWRPKGASPRDYLNVENIALDTKEGARGYPYEIAAAADSAYNDGKITLKSIADLASLKQSGQPFFLAVGYLKPHLPFNAPGKYWDMYPPESIALPDNRARPDDVPDQALHNFGELRHYSGVPENGPLSDSLAHTLIRGYYACVSYTDALIGQLLDALEEEGLSENTIVILWGDHGWNLMEHGLWCKHCNYRTSLKAPLMIRVPGTGSGRVSREMVEFVDIYPTLLDACSIPVPGHAQGNSLMPLVRGEQVNWKSQVESVWKSGFTYTSQSHAYTEWRTETDSVLARMLFDHRTDPAENDNLMDEATAHDVIEAMLERK